MYSYEIKQTSQNLLCYLRNLIIAWFMAIKLTNIYDHDVPPVDATQYLAKLIKYLLSLIGFA